MYIRSNIEDNMSLKFHNFISDVYFSNGIHYWEIIYKGTAKIGISKNTDHSKCFCDTFIVYYLASIY